VLALAGVVHKFVLTGGSTSTSSPNGSPNAGGSTTRSSAPTGSPNAGAETYTLTANGQKISSGPAHCTFGGPDIEITGGTVPGNYAPVPGQPKASGGIDVTLRKDQVLSTALYVANDPTNNFQWQESSATLTHTGNNYKIVGVARPINLSEYSANATLNFEVDATCPSPPSS
jgi:hypothetical protein